MSEEIVYKIIFYNEGKIFEIFAREVYQGNLYGFIEVEALLFGEKSTVLVDPSEEKLKSEFSGVKRTYIPMHSIVRIDEVEKLGPGKIKKAGGKGDNVTHFPSPIYTPSSDSNNI